MIARTLSRLSAALAAIDRLLLMLLVIAIAVFVLMNVLLRMIGVTIAWADEIAIYSMILCGFVGASLMLRGRIDPAVLLALEFSSSKGRRILRGISSVICFSFGVILIYLCWRWFNPIALINAGFDVATFEGATFNFIYTDTTPVMGIPFFWFYLVMPWFAFTITVHSATNLAEDLNLIERPQNAAAIPGGDSA